MAVVIVNNVALKKPKRGRQILASLVSSLGAMCLGMGFVWTEVLQPDSDVWADCDQDCWNDMNRQATWVEALFELGAVFSALLTGITIGAIGRKWTLVAVTIPTTIGWLVLTLIGVRKFKYDIQTL